MRMMTIHAHPDDESSKGAGSVALYSDAGVKATLVCCTGGEEGDILNPAMDLPEVRENIGSVRRDELSKAAEIIGYEKVHYLEYRDSGMPDSQANKNPDCFANAPLEEAVERLVRIIRKDKPHVIVTYPDDQQGYQHPDHLKVYDISIPAWEAAGDATKFPDSGEPWTPLKLYYTTWSRARIEALHAMFQRLELESPFNDAWFERPSQDHRITTKIDVSDHSQRRTDALLAHATQVDPDSPFWFGLPSDKSAEAYPWDDYILAFNRVGPVVEETDLFEGLS
ncbi:MAG: mycothiol conjugate amidase Mca [Acidimicrobiaceae bacterium TMED77]|nr:MAG: mycothiol conjugate amidase Mca [Acidimicrobiaceae bacterium TMED77]